MGTQGLADAVVEDWRVTALAGAEGNTGRADMLLDLARRLLNVEGLLGRLLSVNGWRDYVYCRVQNVEADRWVYWVEDDVVWGANLPPWGATAPHELRVNMVNPDANTWYRMVVKTGDCVPVAHVMDVEWLGEEDDDGV